jgi:hypothetical protein
MLVGTTTPELQNLAAEILNKEIGVKPTSDLQAIFWANPETQIIEWCVGFDGFLGKTCQIHVVNFSKKYTPRKLLFAVFDYAFNKAGVETLIGTVNSLNEQAMQYDQNLGFTEKCRFEGVHDNGGDLVIFEMKKADCRFIREQKYET